MPDLVPVDYDPFRWGDPEGAGAAAASTAMAPVTGPYLRDVASGTMARRGIEDVNAAFANHDYAALAGMFGPAAIKGPPANGMLAHINQLTNDRMAADAGEHAAGSPARSFSEIEAADAAAPRGYEIMKAGEPAGSVQMSFPSPDTGYIDFISGGKIGQTSPLGPRAVRDVGRQLFDANPAIDELQGWRVSGARAAGGSGDEFLSATRDQLMGGGNVIRDPGMIELVRKYGIAALGLPAGAGALIPVDHEPVF